MHALGRKDTVIVTSPMSIALTATAVPVVIDLTIDTPTTVTPLTSPYNHGDPTQQFQLASQQPPAKKRRVENDGPGAEDVEMRMRDYLLPYVQKAVDKLARDACLVDKIAIEVGGYGGTLLAGKEFPWWKKNGLTKCL